MRLNAPSTGGPQGRHGRNAAAQQLLATAHRHIKHHETHLLLATLVAGALHGRVTARRGPGIAIAIFLVVVARGGALEPARAGRAGRRYGKGVLGNALRRARRGIEHGRRFDVDVRPDIAAQSACSGLKLFADRRGCAGACKRLCSSRASSPSAILARRASAAQPWVSRRLSRRACERKLLHEPAEPEERARATTLESRGSSNHGAVSCRDGREYFLMTGLYGEI
jgi:hypothetical protein